MTLRAETQQRILRNFAHRLTPEDHWARVDFLLWTGQITRAREVMPHISAEMRDLANERIRLAGGASANLTASQAEDPNVVYQRARWDRRRGRDESAIRRLAELTRKPDGEAGRRELWDLQHLMAREALELRNYQAAYDIVDDTGIENALDRHEAEFLAGWIALRFIDRPLDAARHFAILTDIVATPVSLSRGLYWQGRAAEALAEMEEAENFYRQAADLSTTYYGMLAAERLEAITGEPAMLVIPPDPVISDAERAAFEADEQVRAARLLGEMSEDFWFATFAYHIEDQSEQPVEFALLTDLAKEYAQLRPALRVAKSARNRHIPVIERAYPLAFEPPTGPQFAEPELALAISRQETEFDPRAISSANARGLMQLIPATAQTTARQMGRPYRYNWLTDDPGYNAELGSFHLQDLVQRYNGSYIVSMAGYNAGPTRARQWMETYGDPRAGEMDPIDWVEIVPFRETRNYIQRVIENLQVYRARMNGNQAPITITEDITRGSIPQAQIGGGQG